jgi:hypothetical protein
MLFGTNNIKAVEGNNFYDITFGGMQTITDPYQWSATLLNGIPVFSNGKDVPLYWDGNGANDALALTGFPVATSVGYIVAFKFHLFGLNIDGPSGEFENQIMWSDATDPGALPTIWTPAPSNESGSAILADTPGRCVTGVPLGSQLMIYKPESVYPVEYAGQQPDNIFTVRAANRSIGALGPHTVKDLGTTHVVVGNEDVCIFDGVNVKSIADNRVKRAIFNSIDQTYAANSFVVRDLNKHEVWICIPESGSRFATIAHIWDERRDTWSTLDLTAVRYGTTGLVTDTTVSNVWNSDSNVWDSDPSAWNESDIGAISHVAVAQQDTIYVEDTTDATSVTATIAKYDLFFDDDSQSKIINGVWIRGTGLGFANIQFRLGSRADTSANIAWQSFQNANPDGSLTIPEIDGRYISIEITATSTDVWTINRIIFDWKYNGPY